MGDLFDWLTHHHHHHRGDPEQQDAPQVQFNVAAVDESGVLITTPIVIRIDAGLSGSMRFTNPANFWNGPPPPTPWIGDIEIHADGYAPWTTGAAPQIQFHNDTINFTATLKPSGA